MVKPIVLSRLLALLLFFLPFLADGQIRLQIFSSDHDKYILQLTEFLEESLVKEYEASLKVFSKENFPLLSQNQKDQLIKISNRMQKSRYTAYPFFADIVQSLNILIVEEYPASLKDQYLVLLDSVLNGRKADVKTFLGDITQLFESGFLYKSTTLSWGTDGSFELIYIEGEPRAVFQSTNLYMNFARDSFELDNTSGHFVLLKNIWYGKKGKMDWSRLGLNKDSLTCELGRYKINTRLPQIEADSAKLSIKSLGQSMLGRFQDKGQSLQNIDQVKFPSFVAYKDRLELSGFISGMDYHGKYKIEGVNFYCTKSDYEPALIILKEAGRKSAIIKASAFKINNDGFNSEKASFSLYLNNDSIFHRDVTVRYKSVDRRLELIRPNNSGSTFFDSYHNMDIQCDILSWNLDSSFASFSMLPGRANTQALFISSNFYSQDEYESVRGIANYHPLIKLLLYYRNDGMGYREFSADGYASTLGLSLEDTRNLLIELAQKGFIYYNRNTERITIKDKTLNYIDANADKIDYDGIRIVSKVERGKQNGKIDLANYKLDLSGVSRVLPSDSHQVALYPRNKEMSIKKGMDFELSGRILAGPLEFTGSGFQFDYDNFVMHMEDVDSLKFRIFTGRDRNEKPIFTYVRSALENINGDLIIDAPDNKSGREKIYDYPKFETQKESFIYYEFKDIRDSAYVKEEFFFHVDPFSLDSLDYITLNNGLEFDGTLTSAGIFPDFEETVRLQQDLTFGFVTTTPPAGYSIYGGKGHYKDSISLSSNGLMGSGDLSFLEARIKSPAFVFTPDTCFGNIDGLELSQGTYRSISYPKVSVGEAAMFWKPDGDSMRFSKLDQRFNMFSSVTSSFDGNLTYTPKGLYGSGEMHYRKHLLGSENFIFRADGMKSDSAYLRIASDREDLLALGCDSTQLDVDFAKNKAEFKALNERTTLNLQYNELDAIVPEFRWDLRARSFELGNKKGNEICRFETTNPNREGLAFEAQFGIIDQIEYKLEAYGVLGIEVADAVIIPGDNRLTIEKGAQIEPLQNARISLSPDGLHNFNIIRAEADITHGRSFTGSGTFVYNNLGDSAQFLELNSIYVTNEGITEASGQISSKSFSINPGFNFQGSINLYGNEIHPEFKGLIKLGQLPTKIYTQAFKYKGFVDPFSGGMKAEYYISELGDTLSMGVFYDLYSKKPYVLILSSTFNKEDFAIIECKDKIFYNDSVKKYLFGDVNHYGPLNDTCNWIEVNNTPEERALRAHGKVKLFESPAHLNATFAGNLFYGLDSSEIRLDLAALINFKFPILLQRLVRDVFFDFSYNKTDIALIRPENIRKLSYIFEPEQAAIIADEAKLYSAWPEDVSKENLFIFPDFDLVYNSKDRTFISDETKLALGSFSGDPINKFIKGAFEIMGAEENLEISLLLEPDKDFYYHFLITPFGIEAVSSDIEFNDDLVKAAKKKKTTKKLGYQLMLGETANRDFMMRRFK